MTNLRKDRHMAWLNIRLWTIFLIIFFIIFLTNYSFSQEDDDFEDIIEMDDSVFSPRLPSVIPNSNNNEALNDILTDVRWSWSNPSPTGNTLYSVDLFVDSLNQDTVIYTVGDNGTILRSTN